jgi:Nop53 (60S ribosomal biogenesis)
LIICNIPSDKAKIKRLLFLGESYNPTFEDHQDLLQKVADHEGQLIKKEKHIERVTTKMFCKKADIPTEVKINTRI